METAHSGKINAASSRHERGFTLIELLVAMALMAIVSTLIVNLFVQLSRSYMVERVVGETQQDLRRTMERLCVDIRHAGFDPKRSADAGIEAGTATALRFTRDTYDTALNDYSGVIDDTNQERVTYQVDAANQRLVKILYEGTASQTSQTVLENIDPANSGFTYADASGAPTATLDDIRSVVINLALNNRAGWGGRVDRALNTQVKLRNIGLK
jgi:prepilin-type N-terminal cleavage/methylation domain-containing protein